MDQICGYFLPVQSIAKGDNDGDDDGDDGSIRPVVNTVDEQVSPFIATNKDGYVWPNLYSELDECIESCVLIYALAELRRLAREEKQQTAGGIVSPEEILSLPLTHAKIADVVEANKDKLVGTKFADDFYVNILKAAEERHMVPASSVGVVDSQEENNDSAKKERESNGNSGSSSDVETPGEEKKDEEAAEKKNNDVAAAGAGAGAAPAAAASAAKGAAHRKTVASSKIIAFDDEYEKEELVYAIEVNHKRKRITVVFRGSVTKMGKLHKRRSKMRFVHIHRGNASALLPKLHFPCILLAPQNNQIGQLTTKSG